MKKLAISKFKAEALRLLEQVAKSQEPLVILKRGKPLAEVRPIRIEQEPKLGKLAETVLYEGDIISPLEETDWEVCH